jgi:hypothetical protein
MAWIYAQDSGWLVHNGAKLVQCYSGNGSGKNNPDAQAIRDIGPIPCGLYTIGEPQEGTPHGPFAMPLTPDPSNEMFGRSGFWVHGDSLLDPGHASEGCIIEPNVDRKIVWASGDYLLEVVRTLDVAAWPGQ